MALLKWREPPAGGTAGGVHPLEPRGDPARPREEGDAAWLLWEIWEDLVFVPHWFIARISGSSREWKLSVMVWKNIKAGGFLKRKRSCLSVLDNADLGRGEL